MHERHKIEVNYYSNKRTNCNDTGLLYAKSKIIFTYLLYN